MARFTTSDGLSLHYEDTGSGLPVLCLAGLTRSASDFDDLVAAGVPDARLIRLTYRGRGESDRAPDHATYNLAVEARDALELLDHLGIERATIVGTSRGGLIAMLLAATARDRLVGVLLNDIGPVLESGGLDRIKGYLGLRPPARDHAEGAEMLQRDLGPAFPDVPPARWRALAERWFAEAPDGLDLRYDPRLRDAVLDQGAAPAPDLWPLFDALAGLPVAVLRGANSDLLGRATVDEMQARRPDLIAVEVPNRGHVPFLDEPESLGALDALLARVRR